MSIEAMKQALEPMRDAAFDEEGYTLNADLAEAYDTLRQAIEQASSVSSIQSDKTSDAEKQEPFGWVSQHTVKGPYEWQFNKELSGVYRDNAISILPVYTTPLNPLDSIKSSKTLDAQPQREWVGLTPDEVFDIADQHPVEGFDPDIMAYTRAIEAKLKEKNSAT